MQTPENDNHRSTRDRGRPQGVPVPRRIIRTDEVRYPGHATTESERVARPAQGRRLKPARDTGLHVERRLAREKRREASRQRRGAMILLLIVIALFAVGMGWRSVSDRRAAEEPLETRRASAPGKNVAVAAATNPTPAATPLIASYSSLGIRLPVGLEDLTELGFHQASYAYALHLKTKMPDADMTRAKKRHTTGRDVAAQSRDTDAVLVGSVLRLWRDRPGKPDSALDIGAAAGAPVLAPMTGTVVLVKEYDLYNKYPDIQIHIQPDGHPELDAVLIHVSDPIVKAGDRVEAGVTQVAVVRNLADRINMQLADYTGEVGNHTHFQLNNARHPDYEGLKGALQLASPAVTQ